MKLIKSPLRYSQIAIIFVVLMFFIILLLDKNPIIYISNIIFLGPLLAIFLFFSIKHFKDLSVDGLRFWQGFSIGLIYIIFFSVSYAIILLLYSEVFDTSQFNEYRLISVDRVVVQKEMIIDQFDEKAYDDFLASAENQSNFQIIRRLVRNSIIIGVILTPITALFMRTNEAQRPYQN
jgi:hypothetical protein